MRVYYSDEALPDIIKSSLFLAGPTPRLENPVPSWRPDALQILNDLGFSGIVFVPEYSSFTPMRSYSEQVEWEWKALHACDVVIFWIPRDLKTLIGLTTNVEFGFYVGKKPVVYGRPEGSPKNTYLDWLYKKTVNKIPESTLEATILATKSYITKSCWSGEPPCGNG